MPGNNVTGAGEMLHGIDGRWLTALHDEQSACAMLFLSQDPKLSAGALASSLRAPAVRSLHALVLPASATQADLCE